MKKTLFLFFVLQSFFLSAQHLISLNEIRSYTLTQIDSAYSAMGLPSMLMPKDYEVKVYWIMYNSVLPDSITPTQISGLLIIPQNKSCPSSILSYQHGTMMTKAEAPSKMGGKEWVLGLAMGAAGYIAALPDYIGLGHDLVNNHPYQHARSEATATVDMIRAVREVCLQENIDLNGQVLLSGYSQGGHATMAAHRMMQRSFPTEFEVSASVPMSGPYSMSRAMKDVMLTNNPYPAPYYLPYVLLSFQNIYAAYPAVSDFLNTPYDTQLPPLYSGYNSASEVNALMPSVPKNIIRSTVLNAFDVDSNHIFRTLLKDNDVYAWKPESQVHMLYCGADKHVPPQNTFIAYDYMQALGAQVSKMNVNDVMDHTPCAEVAMMHMKSIFDTIRHDRINLIFHAQNPSLASTQDGSISLQIQGVQPPYTVSWSTGEQVTQLNNIGVGLYTVTVSSPNACQPVTASYFLNASTALSEEKSDLFKVFPNPGNGMLHISSASQIGNLKIMHITGEMVYMTSTNQMNLDLDLSHLTPGIYVILTDAQSPFRYIKY